MKHNEQELRALKAQVCEMGSLVLAQLTQTKQAFLTNDAVLARTVISREKRVNAYELKIDRDVENYIALHTPVAVDLRLALSLIRLSLTLERIADFAAGIAAYIIEERTQAIDQTLCETLHVETIFSTVITMLGEAITAFDTENTQPYKRILEKDEAVDEIYHQAFPILAEQIKSQQLLPEQGLKLVVLMRKIERIGDHCSNMVEEIVFYVDAKVLKHHKNKHKSDAPTGEGVPL